MSIGKRIKELRESKGLTQGSLAELIGVTKSAVGNYELDLSGPKETVLYKLIDVLECDANYLFQDGIESKSDQFKVTPKEQAHIKKYRALEPNGKEMVDTVLDKEYEFLQQRRSITEHAKEFTMLEPPKIIPSYQGITGASAGIGLYVFDDLVPNMIEVDSACKADFVIDVCGDSMQPTFNDGDGLLVIKQDSVDTGEIGIFMIDNEAYVKECGGDRFISHNKEYADILLKEHQDIRCIGKVLGKLK